MKIKKYIIIFLILLCCGCRTKYELDFNDTTINENLTIKYDRSEQTDEQLNEYYKNTYFAIGREKYYNFENKSTKNEVILNFNYKYDISDFKLSNIANSCFTNFKFVADEEKYYFLTTGPYKCLNYEYINLDVLDIVISTNHNVLENNADEIKDNKYIWHVSQENNNISIKFVTDKRKKEINKSISYKTIILSSVILSGILLIIGSFIFIKHKKVNKI